MGRMVSLCGLILSVSALSACTTGSVRNANLGDIFGTSWVNAKAVTADYRLFLARPPYSTANSHIVCTEPSPDIAKAVSQAISENAQVAIKNASGQSLGVSEAVQYQTAQTIAQLGKRFATVQVLRDVLYNDCLA